MKIEDYLELYSSYIRTLIETNPTDFAEETLIESVIDTVNTLRPLRLDDYAINRKLTLILNKYRNARKTPDGEINHYENTVDSNILSHILLKYFKREKSYYHAYLRLQQEENCRVALHTDIVFMTEQEIEDAVLTDIQSERKVTVSKETFYDLLIHDDKDHLLKQLHELLAYKKGKDVATIMKAMEKHHLLKPYSSISSLHALITSEFGNIGGLRNFSNYMQGIAGYQLKDSDIDEYTNIII